MLEIAPISKSLRMLHLQILFDHSGSRVFKREDV